MSHLKDFFTWKKLVEAANGEIPTDQLNQIEVLPGESARHKLNPVAASAYNQMVDAAKKDGITWGITDSYRTLDSQVRVAKKKGLYSKGGLAAKPGTSNHGWGSAVDLDFKKGSGSAAGQWLRNNAANFGFTNIPREPWHWEHKASALLIKSGSPVPKDIQTKQSLNTWSQSIQLTGNPSIDAILKQMTAIQSGTSILKSGTTGDSVKVIQAKLKDANLYSGEITGNYDAATIDAVKKLQTKSNIAVDGIFGPASYAAIYGTKADSAAIATAEKEKGEFLITGGTVKSTYSGERANNIKLLIEEMIKQGLTNPYAQIGMVSTIGKESSFIPKSEYSYRNTDNGRLRTLFGDRLSKYSDVELTALKQDDVKFYDAIYGLNSWNQNNNPGDGFKYRGRGFNQITFKASYKKYGDLIGMDLVSNPDLLNDPKVAAKAAVAFFVNGLKGAGLSQNSFKDKQSAVEAFVKINHGGHREVVGSRGYEKAMALANNFEVGQKA